MVQLDIIQGYGHHESDCSSEQRLPITSQCCKKETEDMAAPECEREARKKRERHDSGCAHERKERRPHSEERPPPPPPLHDYNRLESERRAERLSRARRPQYGQKRRRAPIKLPKQPKENECYITTEDICSSPIRYDFAVLQQPQLCEEPERLDANALRRAADREESERNRRDERIVAPLSVRRDQPSPDRRLDKINKKINILKKNISKYESDFESQHGHAISPSDRITDVQLTRMYETLRKLQAEKKCIKADPVEYTLRVQAVKQQKERDERLDAALKRDTSMAEAVQNIEEWLDGCRNAAGRSSVPESNWSHIQLAAEKYCVQRALLRLEAARGRPAAYSADRGSARHLYERYRAVKRALAVCRPDAVSANNELATIHEHEAMLFNTSVDSSSDSQERQSDSLPETNESSQTSKLPVESLTAPLDTVGAPQGIVEAPLDILEAPLASPPAVGPDELNSTSSAHSGTTSEEAPTNEGLHYLPLDDLNRALSEAKTQKTILRRSIKEYEVTFEIQNNRKVQRDDKKIREAEYLRYKAVKARIKLLNALINKQKTVSYLT